MASNKDPELHGETRDVKSKFPFALSTFNSKPVQSRFLVSMRTKNDYDDTDKYNPANTVEAI